MQNILIEKLIAEHRSKAVVTCDERCFCWTIENILTAQDAARVTTLHAADRDGGGDDFMNKVRSAINNARYWMIESGEMPEIKKEVVETYLNAIEKTLQLPPIPSGG